MNLPAHIENDLARLGVVVLLVKKPVGKSASEAMPQWKPTFKGEEPPF